MNEKRGVMKLFLTASGLFLLLVLWSVSLEGVSVNWGTAGNPLYDESGVGSQTLEAGDLVQLICDKAKNGIDPPGPNGMPVGDDVVVHTSRIGQGTFFSGEFSDNITTGSIGVGDILYVRAWNDSTLDSAGRWGDTRQHDPQKWVVDNNLFFTVNVTENGSWATTGYKLKSCSGVFEAMVAGVEEGADRVISSQRGTVLLLDPSPNPFRGATAIGLNVGSASEPVLLSLEIFDIRGCRVRSFRIERDSPGETEIVWDGRDESGVQVTCGVYVCRLRFAGPGGGPAVSAKLVCTN